MNELAKEVNTLLAYLRSFRVLLLIHKEFAEHGNSAPVELLKESINRVQKLLDKKEDL